MPNHFPWLNTTAFTIARAVLSLEQRSFHADALALAQRLKPPLQIHGNEALPACGPRLIVVNHYSRPGFPSWWIAIALSAAFPQDIHWVMTAAWVFPGQPVKAVALTPLTRWIFRRIARVYGFTTMPPMPPRSHEAADRARAVREVLGTIRREPEAVIGLAPEGGDSGPGGLSFPPPGAGRFLYHLAASGLAFIPAGVYETGDELHVRFGQPYRLALPPGLTRKDLDFQAIHVVMRSIARLLPPDLQGEFRTPLCEERSELAGFQPAGYDS